MEDDIGALRRQLACLRRKAGSLTQAHARKRLRQVPAYFTKRQQETGVAVYIYSLCCEETAAFFFVHTRRKRGVHLSMTAALELLAKLVHNLTPASIHDIKHPSDDASWERWRLAHMFLRNVNLTSMVCDANTSLGIAPNIFEVASMERQYLGLPAQCTGQNQIGTSRTKKRYGEAWCKQFNVAKRKLHVRAPLTTAEKVAKARD